LAEKKYTFAPEFFIMPKNWEVISPHLPPASAPINLEGKAVGERRAITQMMSMATINITAAFIVLIRKK
jgi:hypothetical protein